MRREKAGCDTFPKLCKQTQKKCCADMPHLARAVQQTFKRSPKKLSRAFPYLPPLIQKVVHVIRKRLGIGGGSAAADVDLFRDLDELVGGAVSDVGPGRRSRVGANDDASLVGERHDRGSGADLTGFETGGDAVSFVEDLEVRHYLLSSFRLGVVVVVRKTRCRGSDLPLASRVW